MLSKATESFALTTKIRSLGIALLCGRFVRLLYSGAPSRIMWALVPPYPKLLMDARSGLFLGQSVREVGTYCAHVRK